MTDHHYVVMVPVASSPAHADCAAPAIGAFHVTGRSRAERLREQLERLEADLDRGHHDPAGRVLPETTNADVCESCRALEAGLQALARELHEEEARA